MQPTLAAYAYLHNCIRIDYPFIESALSSLLIADRVFLCDCDSTDGTWEAIQSLARAERRVEVMRHPWGQHYRIQGQICNGILERIGTDYTFAIQIQADEIVCEWTVDPFRRDLEIMAHQQWQLGRPKYRHFCPDYRTTWPFIYERKAILSATRFHHRYDSNSDGCSMAGAKFYETSLEIHHVGKVQVGREEQALHKELTFQQLYESLGFPDPKFIAQSPRGRVDYREAFAGAQFSPYDGPHPALLLPRILRAEAS